MVATSSARGAVSLPASPGPISFEAWLRYQVEAVRHLDRSDGRFSARCAAASLRMKLRSALHLNLIDEMTAHRLSTLLQQQMTGLEDPA